MLDEEELVGRRDQAVDLAEIEEAPGSVRRAGIEGRGDVGERHIDLALCQRRQRPFGHERQCACGGDARA